MVIIQYKTSTADSTESEESITTEESTIISEESTYWNSTEETTPINNLIMTLQPETASNEEENLDLERNLCKENEVYDCLPLCPPRCSLLSRIVCRKLHKSIRKCTKGCTCKPGFKLDRMTEKCVKRCP